MLNLVLGGNEDGGWAQGRVINIVGDRSAGKTGLAIEACANFARRAGTDRINYGEAEAAFDEQYAQTIGMPKGLKLGERIETIESFSDDILDFVDGLDNNGLPALYVLDSLDAISDDEERKADLDKSGYGTAKAKLLSKFFRKEIRRLEDANVTLMIISQVRDNIGVMFGDKNKRSGGRALDFYCSQILWLSETGKIKQIVRGQERKTGITVRARTKKNKMALPFREADLVIKFNYGIDDEESMLNWLKAVKVIDAKKASRDMAEVEHMRKRSDRAGLRQFHKTLVAETTEIWLNIEEALEPPMRKYED